MATITQSQAELGSIRQSQEDAKRVFAALLADGVLTVVPDEEVEPAEDEEGNELPPEQATATSDALVIEVENTGEEEAEADTSGYPGTHAKLDELAAANGIEWDEGVSSVADKQAQLAAAGVEPA